MREVKQLVEVRRDADAASQSAKPAAQLCAAITKIADLGRTALGAGACAIAWDAPGGAADTVAATTAAADEAASAVRTALAVFTQQPGSGAQEIRAEIHATEIAPGVIGVAIRDGAIVVWVALAHLKNTGRIVPKTQAILELVGRAALAAVAQSENANSRRFWRIRGAAVLARDAATAASGAAREAQRETLERAAREIAALTGPGRMAAMGEAVARALGCRRWLVAAPRAGMLRIVAAARAIAPPRELPESSVIVECSRSGKTITCLPDSTASRARPEDKIFGGAWIVFSARPAVIGLAEGDIAASGFAARAEAFGARLAPLVRAWIAEDTLDECRALVNRLALRMYTAIDDERARIARDLHDDQAQLLAAAQIALDGGTEEARNLFRQIAQELRARIRELKPPALGRIILADALESEAERMRRQGIEVHLLKGKDAARISPAVQRLCWQVAREALANVARHSGASTVEVAVDREDHCSRVIVRDNGRGMPAGSDAHATAGIGGIRERLELMGGKLEIESGPSGTVLRAEIPEPA
ncbi:MAG: ATP-binding protein [Candidatus Binataceae bacterium]